MENFLNAKAFVTFILWTVTAVNVSFAIEGDSPIPEYMRTVFIADAVDLGIWLVIGIFALIWWRAERDYRRRKGILRYDGQRGEWYYQK